MLFAQKFRNSTSSGGDIAAFLGIPIYTPNIVPSRRKADLVINWGLSHIPWLYSTSQVINHPTSVKVASNKLKTFERLNEVRLPIPLYTTSRETALEWIVAGNKVMCRTLLSASGGRGIVVAKVPEDLVDAPLYVKYIEKRYEFRVHIAFNQVIRIQQKRRLSSQSLEERGITTRNKYIRNLENGYIFSTDLVNGRDALMGKMSEVSIRAIDALGLHFGAVDIIVSSSCEYPYILEINTAPGLEGGTLEAYNNAFREHINCEEDTFGRHTYS